MGLIEESALSNSGDGIQSSSLFWAQWSRSVAAGGTVSNLGAESCGARIQFFNCFFKDGNPMLVVMKNRIK